jgi:hypothetical protein
MMSSMRIGAGIAIAGLATVPLVGHPASGEPPWQAFYAAAGTDARIAREALDEIAAQWRDGYASMVVDLATLLPSPRRELARAQLQVPNVNANPGSAVSALPGPGERPTLPDERPGATIRRRLHTFLENQTRQRFGDDLRAWQRWIWSRPYAPHADYASFKGELYGRIDPAFRSFFPVGVNATIRLDEIAWGGVRVNGIPPLRLPKTTPAAAATWLRDGHVVFGLEINGEARAYPKRILAWHELATDRLGGLDLIIVYCTLCGTVIPYHSQLNGRRFTFGTSGLLYRSNKLMFDEETRSLWSSVEGRPVVGSLAGAGLQLAFSSAVTTTWGEWRREHPTTSVLSLETGFKRDYSEGAAYRDYFASDRLMFEVPETDSRLKNKAEVLVLRRELIGAGAAPVAIAVERLKQEPVFSFEAGQRRFVVVTSPQGANRLYERGSVSFVRRGPDGRVSDTRGQRWRVTPEALVSETGERLARVPAHRAFWFGWRAQHPDTVLYK